MMKTKRGYITEFHGDRETGTYTDTRARTETDPCAPPYGAIHADIYINTDREAETHTESRDITEDLEEQIAELQCEVDYNNAVIEKYRALVREYEQEIKWLKERLGEK